MQGLKVHLKVHDLAKESATGKNRETLDELNCDGCFAPH